MADKKQARPEEKYVTRARRTLAGLSPEARGYLALAIGIALVLFFFGFFQFLNVVIGGLGIGLIIWGAYTTKILETLKSWVETVKKRFS